MVAIMVLIIMWEVLSHCMYEFCTLNSSDMCDEEGLSQINITYLKSILQWSIII